MASELDYVPLPAALIEQVQEDLEHARSRAGGHPVWTAAKSARLRLEQRRKLE